MKFFLLFLLFFTCFSAFSQTTVKHLVAVRTKTPPKIDGLLDDDAWKNVPIATGFVEYQPVAGQHEKQEERTEVKVIYDDDAIYIGVAMYETSPAKISRELTNRDSLANDDFIGILLDTYNDGINASGFYVTAAGVQLDAKYSPPPTGNNINSDNNGYTEDFSWNAVWESKVNINSHGWTAEFKIPYSALRFSKKDIQTWGINFVRMRQREQKKLFWNEVDPKKTGLINQGGELDGIENITPPVRLAFYPYISTYINHYPYNTPGLKNTSAQFDGGMDLKYGINESFTLDLTLVPDFGQVQSDNQILNLTPFEVKYVDNRPFFTEGTELFDKGNIFYSRRVGGQPINYDAAYTDLKPGEQVISNPTETKLLNAIKVTGRMGNGLGIGIFNAVTDPAYAVIQDSTGHKRQFETQPFTNYNILVLDQNLKNNSSVTLINTNVDRFGKDYSADVGGFVFSLNNKKNSYNVNGYGLTSNLLYPGKTVTGYSYEINAGKTLGDFTWNIIEDRVDDKYNPNDLGILDNNNYFDHNLNLQYFNYKPAGYFLQWGIYSNIYYSRRENPSTYQYFNQAISSFMVLKNLWQVNVSIKHILPGNDFYEPRVAGRVFQQPGSNDFTVNINTNNAKVIYGGLNYTYYSVQRFNAYGMDAEAFYTLRINNHFSFGQDVTYNPNIHYTGFSTIDSVSKNPIFALRNVRTIQNIFNLKYTFNNVMGLTFRLRHYWSKLNDLQYFDLAQNGSLAPLTSSHFVRDNDMNYNDWNIDMLYEWEFAPGSELSFDWKNSSLVDNELATQNYLSNFGNTIHGPKNNNFSLKILYYIDYQGLRKKQKG